MTQETKTKKNLDYSASAVNLTNPPEVAEVLRCQIARRMTLNQLRNQAEDCVPLVLRNRIKELEEEIASENEGIKGYIDSFGSYQNLDLGIYALKQRRVSVSYDPKTLRSFHPAEANLVIEETVNSTKINGLIRGGLLDPGTLKTEGITKEAESFVYIIK